MSAIGTAIDNDTATVYYGTAGTGSNRPYVNLYLGRVEQVTAVKITPAAENYDGDASDRISPSDLYKHRIFGYKVEISLDGANWTVVKEGNAYTGSAANPDSWVEQRLAMSSPYWKRRGMDGVRSAMKAEKPILRASS